MSILFLVMINVKQYTLILSKLNNLVKETKYQTYSAIIVKSHSTKYYVSEYKREQQTHRYFLNSNINQICKASPRQSHLKLKYIINQYILKQ
jgi:hypothetical protein